MLDICTEALVPIFVDVSDERVNVKLLFNLQL